MHLNAALLNAAKCMLLISCCMCGQQDVFHDHSGNLIFVAVYFLCRHYLFSPHSQSRML